MSTLCKASTAINYHDIEIAFNNFVCGDRIGVLLFLPNRSLFCKSLANQVPSFCVSPLRVYPNALKPKLCHRHMYQSPMHLLDGILWGFWILCRTNQFFEYYFQHIFCNSSSKTIYSLGDVDKNRFHPVDAEDLFPSAHILV